MNHWWFIKASTDSFLMCWQLNVHFTPLYKEVKTWRTIRLYNNLKTPKLCQNCSTSKSSLEISFQSPYLRNSRVLMSLYLICIVSTFDCISSVQCQTFFFASLFDYKSLVCVLEHISLLIVFLSIESLLLLCLSIWSLLLSLAMSICNQILHFSELSLEVQGGQDYFRFVEETCIIALCLLSLSLSLFLSAAT